MYRLFKKDLQLFVKDRRTVLLTFLLPIILITLFAFAFGGIGGSSESEPVDLLVSDLDQSQSSKDIVSKLDSLKGLNVIESSFVEAKAKVVEGKYPGVLIFHSGFEKAISSGDKAPVELMYDKAREMEIGMLQPVIISNLMSSIGRKSITQNIENYLLESFPGMDSGMSAKILGDASGSGSGSVDFDMDSSLKLTSIVGEVKESNLGLIQAVAGTAIMMLLFSVAGLGSSILEEKENGTIKRLLCSPLNPTKILYGKMLFTFVVAVLQLLLMFGFAGLAFGLDLSSNPPALGLMILATAFAVSSFGIFLAAISKTRQQAQSLSTLVILIMSAIGGSMIPLFIMPPIMQKIAVVSMNYWGIQGFYDIFWRALPLEEVLPRVAVLLSIGLVMTVISIQLFKKTVLKLV